MLSMKDIARSGHVTRWHSVRTTRDQTLAEHHYMVAMVAQAMAEKVFRGNFPDDQYRLLMDYALRHDTPELVLGDMPGPVKRRLEQRYGDHNPLEEIEAEVCGRFKAAKDRVVGTPLLTLVKLADIADAIAFIKEEGVTQHAEVIEARTRDHFEQNLQQARQQFPELAWEGAAEVLEEMLYGPDAQVVW